MVEIDVQALDIEPPSWIEKVEPFIQLVLQELEYVDNAELSVTFTNDTNIKKINKEYRNKDSATDVLSFCQSEGFDLVIPGVPISLGDIVISIETLKTNSEYFNENYFIELQRLIIHGVLHLMGMDHSDNDPSQPMLVKQEKLLLSLKENTTFYGYI